MGLFKFIKEAGAKIFGGSAAAATPEKLQQEVRVMASMRPSSGSRSRATR